MWSCVIAILCKYAWRIFANAVAHIICEYSPTTALDNTIKFKCSVAMLINKLTLTMTVPSSEMSHNADTCNEYLNTGVWMLLCTIE